MSIIEKKTCPKCGRLSMIRKRLPNGKYTLICEICGTRRGEFIEDTKKGYTPQNSSIITLPLFFEFYFPIKS